MRKNRNGKTASKLDGLKAKRAKLEDKGTSIVADNQLLDIERKRDTLISAVRAMVYDAYEGDYQSGVEFLAHSLVDYANGDLEHAMHEIVNAEFY